jgi:hypothetical protein
MAFRTRTRNPDVRKAISALKMAFDSLEGWELVHSDRLNGYGATAFYA